MEGGEPGCRGGFVMSCARIFERLSCQVVGYLPLILASSLMKDILLAVDGKYAILHDALPEVALAYNCQK